MGASGPNRQREIIAIGGGKGGIGKSFLSANAGICLADMGYQTILVDADLGGANLHTWLGVPPPPVSLGDFLDRRIPTIDEAIVETSVPGLRLISGAMDQLDVANPKYTQKLRLLREISRLDVDFVIIDLGAGTHFNVLDFFLIADQGILTVLPEPTSIENTYRFIHAAFVRRLRNADGRTNGSPQAMKALDAELQLGRRSPVQLIRQIMEQDPERGRTLVEEIEAFRLKLVVNQTRTTDDFDVASAMRSVCLKYFGLELELLGSVPHEDAVWRAIRKRTPLVRLFPDSRAARAVAEIARALCPARLVRPGLEMHQ